MTDTGSFKHQSDLIWHSFSDAKKRYISCISGKSNLISANQDRQNSLRWPKEMQNSLGIILTTQHLVPSLLDFSLLPPNFYAVSVLCSLGIAEWCWKCEGAVLMKGFGGLVKLCLFLSLTCPTPFPPQYLYPDIFVEICAPLSALSS